MSSGGCPCVLVMRFGIGMGSPSHLLQQGAIVMRTRHASAPRCAKSCGVKHLSWNLSIDLNC